MKPGRHLSVRKRQVMELVEALDDENWSPPDIGHAIGYTGQHIRNILRDLGRTPATLERRISRLPAQKLRKLEAWRKVFFDSQTYRQESEPDTA